MTAPSPFLKGYHYNARMAGRDHPRSLYVMIQEGLPSRSDAIMQLSPCNAGSYDFKVSGFKINHLKLLFGQLNV